MPLAAIFTWILSPIGRIVMIAFCTVILLSVIYVKGRVDGKAAYQAKLIREINTAITKGDQARMEALKKFDSNKEIEDDGYSRD